MLVQCFRPLIYFYPSFLPRTMGGLAALRSLCLAFLSSLITVREITVCEALPTLSLLAVDLLKKLLVQQLGFSEKGTLEDRQRFPRFRTVSQEAQTENGSELGLQHSDDNKFHQPGADRMLPRTETHESTASYGLRTSAESPASGDAMQLIGRDPRSSSNSAIDRMSMNLEISTAELEGVGADESGEHFFDAREAHSDENPSESELMERKEEEDVQIRISGERISFPR